jgi:electron transport complex protein RnfG
MTNQTLNHHKTVKMVVDSSTKEPSSRRLIISMAVAGFISGLIIISIYLITFDTIKANKAKELREAVFKVLPNVTRMEKQQVVKNALLNDELVTIAADGMNDDMIFAGYDVQNKLIGYAIQGKGAGFQDTIHVLFGYLVADKLISGMEILDSRETPGLGDKIFKDRDFVGEFINLSMIKNIKAVKKGKKTQINEIAAITGATISSKAVGRIINKAFNQWSPILKNRQ